MAPRNNLTALLLATAVVLTACSSGGSPTPAAGGRTLVIDTSFDLKTADPGRMYEATGLFVGKAVYETLLTFDGGDVTRPVPALAESYTLSDGGKVLTPSSARERSSATAPRSPPTTWSSP